MQYALPKGVYRAARRNKRFTIEQCRVNADVFIEFPKRLMAGAKREIFLLAGSGPAHTARNTRAFAGSPKRKLRLS